jgi:hypothetical protein
MARKLGVRIRRASTHELQVQIDTAVALDLKRLAERRNVSAATLCRIMIEAAVRSPQWVERLLDDAFEERREP